LAPDIDESFDYTDEKKILIFNYVFFQTSH